MIRHIIWDFDGTLFDTYAAIVHSFVEVPRSEFRLEYAPAVIRSLLHVDTRHCAMQIGREHGVNPDEILARARAAYDAQDAVVEEPFDAAREVCEAFARRGSNTLVTHRDRASTVEMLGRFEMMPLFSVIITADDGFAPKPAPDSFLHALEVAFLSPHDTLAVGDRDLDVEAAIGAGVHSAYFSPEGAIHPRAEFSIHALGQIMELRCKV